jgi:hypothetical protein
VVSTLVATHLFEKANHPITLDNKSVAIFQHVLAKLLWAALRAKLDLLVALSFVMSQAKAPDEDKIKKFSLHHQLLQKHSRLTAHPLC